MIKFIDNAYKADMDCKVFRALSKGEISIDDAIKKVEYNNGIPDGTISRNEFIAEVVSLGYKVREER